MCDFSCPPSGSYGAIQLQCPPCSESYALQSGDSSPLPDEAVELADDDYLAMKWSHTARFLREFTQRKTAQAVEIRQHRAALLALTTEGRSGALVATQEGTGPFSNGQEQRAPGAADDKMPWQESSWEDTPSNMLKLRPSTTMRASFMLRTPPGGGNASLSSLDILLQNVLQRSTAVSTKLTKAYAQGVDKEHDDTPSEPLRASHASLRKLATHARSERIRISRIQRQTPLQQQLHEESLSQHHGQSNVGGNAVLSPAVSRSSSPSSTGMRESRLSQRSSTARSISPTRLDMRTGIGDAPPLPREGQRQFETSLGASPQPPSTSPLQQQQLIQQQVPTPAVRGKCASSNGYKSSPMPRRNLVGRRVHSNSLDGTPGRLSRRSDGPYTTAGDGPPAECAAHNAASYDLLPQARISSTGVRLPQLSHVGCRSMGGAASRTGDGRLFTGHVGALKPVDTLTCEGDPFGQRAASDTIRRRAAALQTNQPQPGSASNSQGLMSPTGQSSWAKSRTPRGLVFTQF